MTTPVPSLLSMCARVLQNNNVTFTDTDATSQRLNALITANETVKVHQVDFANLQAEVRSYVNDMNTIPENLLFADVPGLLDDNLVSLPNRYLNTGIDLRSRIAQLLKTMRPMVDWLSQVKDDPFYTETYTSYLSMYEWLEETGDTLLAIVDSIKDKVSVS